MLCSDHLQDKLEIPGPSGKQQSHQHVLRCAITFILWSEALLDRLLVDHTIKSRQSRRLSKLSCYPCFGFSPYSVWSNAVFSFFSNILLIHEEKSFCIIISIREVPIRSAGSPPSPTRLTTHAPLLVLRNTCGSGKHIAFSVYIFRSHLLEYSQMQQLFNMKQPQTA